MAGQRVIRGEGPSGVAAEDKGASGGEERLQSGVQGRWCVESRYGGKKSQGGFEVFALQSIENKVKDRGFVCVNIPAEHVESAKDIDLMRALERRNRGVKDGVPEWVLQGLSEVPAHVDWLLSVKVPPGVKKGRKIAFTLQGEKVKAVYNGDGEGGGKAVFALLSRTVETI